MPEAKKTKVFCPCCPKWEIKRPEVCSNTLVYKRKKLYFCTKRCKERFEKAPEKFAV
ncbi:MAG: YHS domain-containing protein [Candidatus Obscuribacterales bacterium]|nr:YHS domain-containing protein [Candidatus Obscuribacterales bacterium]